MASITISRPDVFPAGTSVGAYVATVFGVPVTGAPFGSAVETQAVQSGGQVTFSALADGTSYVLHGTVSGQPRYLRVNTSDSLESAQSGSIIVSDTRPDSPTTGLVRIGLPVDDGGEPSPPSNTVAPSITTDGTPQTGETVTCSTGTWAGSPTGYTYQWQRNGSNISGATANSRTLTGDDEAQALRCVVTATNAGGSTSANSGTITPTAASGGGGGIDSPVEALALKTIYEGNAQTVNPAATLTAGRTAILLTMSDVVTSVTDSKGNTWTVDVVSDGEHMPPMCVVSARITTAITPTDTITINYAGSANLFRYIDIQTVGGLKASAPFDDHAAASGFSNSPAAGPTDTLAQADEFVIAFSGSFSEAGGWVKGAGFSDPQTPSIANTFGVQWKIVSSTAPVSAAATWTTTYWDMVVATYKGA